MPFLRSALELSVRNVQRFVALDTETTGVGSDDRIIDLYAIEVDPCSGKTGASIKLRCNPQRASHPRAYEKHRIHEDDLLDAPAFGTHATQLSDFLAGSCIIAHNARFDARMLKHEYERIDAALFDTIDIRFSCSMLASQEILGRKNWPSLDLLCDLFAVDRSVREAGHAAEIDVVLLTLVLPRLHDEFQNALRDARRKNPEFAMLGEHSHAIFGHAVR